MTTVFTLDGETWQAMWQGRMAAAVFNSRGAAVAWLAICDAKQRWRA